MTCIADHVEIRVTECMRDELALRVPAVEEQDDLALLEDWHDFIEKLAGNRQLRGLAIAHAIANRYRNARGVSASSQSGTRKKKSSGVYHIVLQKAVNCCICHKFYINIRCKSIMSCFRGQVFFQVSY